MSWNNKQFNDYVPDGPLTELFRLPNISYSPRVLKDGADSVGALGALNRVYLNIGLYSEEWLRHFNPIVGGKPITPIEIADAQDKSSYWQATEAQTPLTALYFLKAGRPDRLADAPGGAQHLTSDAAMLERGKSVFAERCARCHSSKTPEPAPGSIRAAARDRTTCSAGANTGPGPRPTSTRPRCSEIVQAPDFLDDNYLSTDFRVPVTLLQTNACSPLATNAIDDNIWDNFSSQTYKSLPSVGTVTVHDPITGEPSEYRNAGRRSRLHARAVADQPVVDGTLPAQQHRRPFRPDPSVEARLGAFQDGIEQMLWPEKRAKDPVLGDKVPGMIDRTTARSYLTIPMGFQPELLVTLLGPFRDNLRTVDERGDIEIGPIPAGVPVGLIANLDLRPDA